MSTTVKVSVSGNGKGALRSAIRDVMVTAGFRRVGTVEFISYDGIRPNDAAALMAKLYEQESKVSEATLTTLSIQSTLVSVEMKRDKNRSI